MKTSGIWLHFWNYVRCLLIGSIMVFLLFGIVASCSALNSSNSNTVINNKRNAVEKCEYGQASIDCIDTSSSLEADYRSYSLLNPGDKNNKYYARIKKVGDYYIVLYHGAPYVSSANNGNNGSIIWYATSKDLKKWSKPTIIWRPTYYVDVEDSSKKDKTLYMNPDLLVLKDGTLFVYGAYRSLNQTTFHPELNGLMAKKGHLNEKGIIVWDEDEDDIKMPDVSGKMINIGKRILIASNNPWEPHAFLNGDDIVITYSEGVNTSKLKDFKHTPSGTAVIVSSDNGKTWTESKILSQKYTGKHTGNLIDVMGGTKKTVNYYTAQMPTNVVLNDGRIFSTYEMWAKNSDYGIPANHSISASVFSDGYDYKEATGIKVSDIYVNSIKDDSTINDPRGAVDRSGDLQSFTTIASCGSAPYTLQFPSGEVIVSYNYDRIFYVSLLSAGKGSAVYDADTIEALTTSSWGSIALIDSDDMIAAL